MVVLVSLVGLGFALAILAFWFRFFTAAIRQDMGVVQSRARIEAALAEIRQLEELAEQSTLNSRQEKDLASWGSLVRSIERRLKVWTALDGLWRRWARELPDIRLSKIFFAPLLVATLAACAYFPAAVLDDGALDAAREVNGGPMVSGSPWNPLYFTIHVDLSPVAVLAEWKEGTKIPRVVALEGLPCRAKLLAFSGGKYSLFLEQKNWWWSCRRMT